MPTWRKSANEGGELWSARSTMKGTGGDGNSTVAVLVMPTVTVTVMVKSTVTVTVTVHRRQYGDTRHTHEDKKHIHSKRQTKSR